MLGREQGAQVVQRGEGYYFQKLLAWYDNQTLNKLFPFFADYIYHEEANPVLEFIQ